MSILKMGAMPRDTDLRTYPKLSRGLLHQVAPVGPRAYRSYPSALQLPTRAPAKAVAIIGRLQRQPVFGRYSVGCRVRRRERRRAAVPRPTDAVSHRGMTGSAASFAVVRFQLHAPAPNLGNRLLASQGGWSGSRAPRPRHRPASALFHDILFFIAPQARRPRVTGKIGTDETSGEARGVLHEGKAASSGPARPSVLAVLLVNGPATIEFRCDAPRRDRISEPTNWNPGNVSLILGRDVWAYSGELHDGCYLRVLHQA
jgi:hypothetical protein